MSTIIITGGTGYIGESLTTALVSKGHEVVILTRSPEKYSPASAQIRYLKWDVGSQTIDAQAFTNAEYIVHLAGANVGEKRWTRKRKKEIVESRVNSSRLLVNFLTNHPNKIKAVISASAIGWYGANEDRAKAFVESDPPAGDFLGETCQEWEASIEPVALLGIRLVKLRTGIVLSRQGSVLDRFRKPLRFGIATILGRGRQVMSWIHLEDLTRIYIFAIENTKLNGAYNAVSPHPLTNKNLVLELAKAVRGKFYIPVSVPTIVLRTVLGEMSIEVLKSASVSCGKIKKEGYTFLYPSFHAVTKTLV